MNTPEGWLVYLVIMGVVAVAEMVCGIVGDVLKALARPRKRRPQGELPKRRPMHDDYSDLNVLLDEVANPPRKRNPLLCGYCETSLLLVGVDNCCKGCGAPVPAVDLPALAEAMKQRPMSGSITLKQARPVQGTTDPFNPARPMLYTKVEM